MFAYFSPHGCHVLIPDFYHFNNIPRAVQIMQLVAMQFHRLPVTSSLMRPFDDLVKAGLCRHQVFASHVPVWVSSEVLTTVSVTITAF